jgi:xylan 1,4-beta-xylosidase
MMICLSGQDHNAKDFDGHRTFFTARGWRKPICNAFALGARLGEERLPVSGDCAKNCGCIATRGDDGRIAVAVYNHESDFGKEGETAVARLAVTGLSAAYRLERRRIDQVFSNAFTAWSRLGSPQEPEVWEREQILRRARLEKCRPDEDGSGSWKGEVVLMPNAVELLEFIPVEK